jgi:exonuclease SbcD
MKIDFTHITDMHIGSYQGKIEPGGLNSRFVDFVKTWNEAIDFTVENSCRFVLLTGDIFKNKDPQPSELEAFVVGIKKLNDAKIYVIITLGNHDLFLSEKLRHSISAIDKLNLPYVIIKEKPELFSLNFGKDRVQFICMPYPIRSILKLKDNDEVSQYTIDTINKLYDSREPGVPTVFSGHFTISDSVTGTEQMSVDKFAEPVIPKSLFKGKDFVYAAMGHLHKYQKVMEKPLVVYGGSLNRIDFNEWKEDKGFVYVKVDGEKVTDKFIKVNAKNFMDFKFELQNEDDPEQTIISKLKEQEAEMAQSVVRISVTLSEKNRLNYNSKNVIDYLQDHCDYIHGSCIPHIQKSQSKKEVVFDESMNAFEAIRKYADKTLKNKSNKDKFIKFGEEIIRDISGSSK